MHCQNIFVYVLSGNQGVAHEADGASTDSRLDKGHVILSMREISQYVSRFIRILKGD